MQKNIASKSLLAFFAISGLFSLIYLGLGEFLIRSFVVHKDEFWIKSEIFNGLDKKDSIWGDSQSKDGISIPNFANNSFGSLSMQEANIALRKYYSDKRLKNSKIIINASLNVSAAYRLRAPRDFIDDFLKPKFTSPFFVYYSYFQERLPKYYYNLALNGFREIKVSVSNKTINPDGSTFNSILHDKVIHRFSDEKVAGLVKKHMPSPGHALHKNRNIVAMKNLINYLLESGAKICMITPPASRHFRKEASKNPYYSEILDFYSTLSTGFGIKYISFYKENLPDDYFADPVHLNSSGAKFFSPIVYSQCFDSID